MDDGYQQLRRRQRRREGGVGVAIDQDAIGFAIGDGRLESAQELRRLLRVGAILSSALGRELADQALRRTPQTATRRSAGRRGSGSLRLAPPVAAKRLPPSRTAAGSRPRSRFSRSRRSGFAGERSRNRCVDLSDLSRLERGAHRQRHGLRAR